MSHDNTQPNETISLIKKNTELAIKALGPLSDVAQFGLNRESVAWVEGYIERQRMQLESDAKTVSGLINVLGSFLGECLIAAAGGAWQWSKEQQAWGVTFENNTQAFPFAKVSKLFDNGLEGGDSILSFYDIAVDYLAKDKLDRLNSETQDGPVD